MLYLNYPLNIFVSQLTYYFFLIKPCIFYIDLICEIFVVASIDIFIGPILHDEIVLLSELNRVCQAVIYIHDDMPSCIINRT